MAPKSQCGFPHTALDQQIEILNKRASQLAAKHLLTTLSTLLKTRPEFLPDIWGFLASKGVDVEPAKISELGKMIAKTHSKDDAENDGHSLLRQRLSKRKWVVDKALKNWIPYCYRTLDTTRPPILQKLASALEDIAFSKSMLKAMRKVKRSADQYRSMLLEILEYDTGFDVSMPLTGELRHLPTLTSHLQRMRDQRKCRGSNLRLPPNWHSSGDGVFTLKKTVASQILVVNKFTKDRLLLSESSMLSHFGSGICFSELQILNNFSEVRASVGCNKRAGTITIASLPVASGDHTEHDDGNGLEILAAARADE